MATILTLEQYKTAKGITTNDYDNKLNAVIPGVNNFIEKYTQRQFGVAEYTEKRHGVIDRTGKMFVQMKQTPVVSVRSLQVKYFGVTSPLVLDPDNLDLFSEGYAYYYAPINNGQQVIREQYRDNFSYTVIYSGGEAVPESVKLAAIYMTSNAFEYFVRTNSVASGSETTGQIRKVEIGDYTEWYADSDKLLMSGGKDKGMMVTQDVIDLLKPYKRQGQSTA